MVPTISQKAKQWYQKAKRDGDQPHTRRPQLEETPRQHGQYQLKKLEKAGDERPLKAWRATPSKEKKRGWAAKFSLDPSCSWLTAEETHAAGHEERHSSEEVWLTQEMLAGAHVAQFDGASQIGVRSSGDLETRKHSLPSLAAAGRARVQVVQALEGVRKLCA